VCEPGRQLARPPARPRASQRAKLSWARRRTLYVSAALCVAWGSVARCGSPSEYKANFLRVGAMTLTGSPADEVIAPWQSAFFGYFDSSFTMLNLTDS
jgi:hypothetical protein